MYICHSVMLIIYIASGFGEGHPISETINTKRVVMAHFQQVNGG